jgi:GAF domain-containing protein/HAMP domain-containing protein
MVSLHNSHNSEVETLEQAASALSQSLADRADVRALLLNQDQLGLVELLSPLVNSLAADYRIAYVSIQDAAGSTIASIDTPDSSATDVARLPTVADAVLQQQTTDGVVVGPERLMISGASPIFREAVAGEFQMELVGIVEVTLDYDQSFLEHLSESSGADYTMWVSYQAAESAGLGPALNSMVSPSPELFHQASTVPYPLPIPEQAYLDVLSTGQSAIRYVSVPGGEYLVLLAPVLVYEDRVIGILEIITSRAESIASMRMAQLTTMSIAGGMILLAFASMGFVIFWVVLRPVNHLSSVAERQLQGDATAEVTLLTNDEFGQLGQTLNTLTTQLDNTLRGLETTIEQRTRALEERSVQLEATVEVAQFSTSILEEERLIQQTVELIRDRFELYYVGFFQVDDTGEWAVLQAATGEGGQALLARNHRLQVGSSSMIGWSIMNMQTRVAQEAAEDAVRLATPELPETRSEAALPLRSRGQVIGALSVQSTEPGAFDRDTIAILQTMADLVAVALDNARLFAQSQEALEATRRAYGEITRRAWSDMARTRTDWGYVYSDSQISSAEGAWRPEMVRAADAGQITHSDSDGKPSLAVPIKVRDQVVGVLNLRRDHTDQSWSDEEISTIEELVDQLGLSLDSARAFQETQDRAASQRMLGEIATRMRETLDMESVVRTAAQEMRRALGLHSVEIQLGDPEQARSVPEREEVQ